MDSALSIALPCTLSECLPNLHMGGPIRVFSGCQRVSCCSQRFLRCSIISNRMNTTIISFSLVFTTSHVFHASEGGVPAFCSLFLDSQLRMKPCRRRGPVNASRVKNTAIEAVLNQNVGSPLERLVPIPNARPIALEAKEQQACLRQ
jgi:hypothetical protein